MFDSKLASRSYSVVSARVPVAVSPAAVAVLETRFAGDGTELCDADVGACLGLQCAEIESPRGAGLAFLYFCFFAPFKKKTKLRKLKRTARFLF